MNRRIVLDTNVYVSRFLRPGSVPGQAVVKAIREDRPLISAPTFLELRVVLHRPKFARFTGAALLEPYLNEVWGSAEAVSIPSPIRACRDPRDDKFLEVAVHGRAEAIVSGDSDLLEMHPFRGIAILTPSAYLALK